MKIFLLLVIIFSSDLNATEAVPITESACSAASGQWCKAPSILCGQGPSWCNVRTSDAGKMCTDRKQCAGSCVPQNANAVVGTKEIGQCSAYKDAWLSGERLFIEDGVVVASGVV